MDGSVCTFRGDAFGDLCCPWGDGSRDHLGCAKGFSGLGEGKDLAPLRELVQVLSRPYLLTSYSPGVSAAIFGGARLGGAAGSCGQVCHTEIRCVSTRQGRYTPSPDPTDGADVPLAHPSFSHLVFFS